VVPKHGSTLGLDGQNLFFMHACRLYMFLSCMHGSGHCCSCVVMWELIVLLLGSICHECMSIVYPFFMHDSVYRLLYVHFYGYCYA